jgi:hypothetical protein
VRAHRAQPDHGGRIVTLPGHVSITADRHDRGKQETNGR